MKYFAPTLYNMATVIQSCICILSKLKLYPVIIQPPKNLCYVILPSETWHCEDDLALLILNAFSLLFSHLCLLWTWPAGLLSSSFTPWTNSSMSDGFSLHHASLRSHSFTRHLWGFKDQKKKRERKTTGNVKEIFQITSSPCWEDSAVRSHKFVTCIQSSFCSGDHCKHLCFVVFFSPCGSASPLQHRGQLPLPAAATRVSTPDSSLVYRVRHNYRKKKSGLCAL